MADAAGVLLMAYGTPASLADVEAYYTHIRRGSAPPPALLEQLVGRYRAIGGSSPLLEISRAQATGLERALAAATGEAVDVRLGMKHAPPFIEDAVEQLAGAGVARAVGLVLAPHYSAMSVGEYVARARAAAGDRLELLFVEDWHLAQGYIELLAAHVRDALATLPAAARAAAEVVFTAHSLPVRILEAGDPYPAQLEETAAAVAERAGVERWSTAWQSAGRTADAWLGPDILDVLRDRAAGGACSGLVVCPAGFVADHLEVLYDLDVEARALADELGLPFARTASPNADPAFLDTLADVARARLVRSAA